MKVVEEYIRGEGSSVDLEKNLYKDCQDSIRQIVDEKIINQLLIYGSYFI